jgi:hypothetical protein
MQNAQKLSHPSCIFKKARVRLEVLPGGSSSKEVERLLLRDADAMGRFFCFFKLISFSSLSLLASLSASSLEKRVG